VLALPLGLGKANHIANALYARAVDDRTVRLTIFTALTLEAPAAKSELEKRCLQPFAERVFARYPALDYARPSARERCRRISQSTNYAEK
jgi:acyl-CoA hydrolase